MYPPDDRYLVYRLFGLITIHWYAVCILGGAVLAAWFGARRAERRGHNPDHAWNLLALGLVTSIACARAWYVFNEWPRFEAARASYDSTWRWLLFEVISPAGGGIAIQGAIVGAVLGCYIYTRRNGLNFLEWLDIGAPCMLIGQAIGRWGNFFNQEAYGRPMQPPQPWGLRIDADRRIGPYTDLTQYPVETTRFHPTFLYESIWNTLALIALLTIERWFRPRLLKGDVFLLYGILYSIGRFFIEGLRTDSLCVNHIGGSCVGSLRTAQVVALATIIIFGAILVVRHLRHRTPTAGQDSLRNDHTPPTPSSTEPTV
jgi:phosphatidylglycerol:prolipoprotein diacylglycerol transferase